MNVDNLAADHLSAILANLKSLNPPQTSTVVFKETLSAQEPEIDKAVPTVDHSIVNVRTSQRTTKRGRGRTHSIKRIPYKKLSTLQDSEELTEFAIVVVYAELPEGYPTGVPQPQNRTSPDNDTDTNSDCDSEESDEDVGGSQELISGEHPVLILINAQGLIQALEGPTGIGATIPLAYLPPFSGLMPILDGVYPASKAEEMVRATRPHWLGPGHRMSSRWRNLVEELLKVDLARPAQVYQEVRSGIVETIAFDHLWFLFAPGDLVITPGERCNQAYKVAKVTGGQLIIPEITNSGRGDGQSDNNGNLDDILDPYITQARRRYDELVVECFYYDSDGDILGPTKCQFKVKPYDGEIPISSLPIVPLRTVSGHNQMANDLAKRGLKYLQLTNVSHMYYEGVTSREPEEVDSEVIIDLKTAYTGTSKRFQAPLMENLLSNAASTTKASNSSTTPKEELPDRDLDYDEDDYNNDDFSAERSNRTRHGRRVPPSRATRRTNESDNLPAGSSSYIVWRKIKATIHDTSALDDWRASNVQRQHFHYFEVRRMAGSGPPREVCLLLPRDVPGFALRNRKWHYFYLDNMTPPYSKPDLASNGFDQLAIPKSHKSLVLALVRNHPSGKLATAGKVASRPEMDLVRGKGKGLIILLHGVPGVGKTSTAESVASFTKRPLYPITCGDLGETARDVEESLEAHFTLAHRWGCILLLDEADVFLAKRERGDIKRNALVSVFLRVLEYYAGILFLTTNRVGQFDEAFKSRIHIALYYPPLSREFTLQVWNSCLNQIERQNAERELPVNFDRDEMLTFATKQFDQHARWNGRQIRNAFQTAIALAEYEREEKCHKKLRELGADDEGELSDTSRQRFKKRFRKVLLSEKHFQHVAKAFAEFDSYMLEVQQQTDAEMAEHDGVRADGWDPSEEQGQGSLGASITVRSTISKLSPMKISARDADSDEDDVLAGPIRST